MFYSLCIIKHIVYVVVSFYLFTVESMFFMRVVVVFMCDFVFVCF